MPSPSQITVSQLQRLIGTPQSPLLIDVCIDEDFELDPRLIPSAIRRPFSRISDLVPELQDQRVVVICQKGLKLSSGSAAVLRANGIKAEYLEGGIFAWRDAGAPLVPAEKIPRRNRTPSLWVTRHRPKIDRIACPWLIKRFVDRDAQFLFVAPNDVLDVAEKFQATPFDHGDVFWSHRNEFCTFDVMLKEFCLSDSALNRIAEIVRGADTGRLDLAPEVSGLLAISFGLSRMFKDDHEQVDAGMIVYDALYRWARDASHETHGWPTDNTDRVKHAS